MENHNSGVTCRVAVYKDNFLACLLVLKNGEIEGQKPRAESSLMLVKTGKECN
jgi:hypothetical protein